MFSALHVSTTCMSCFIYFLYFFFAVNRDEKDDVLQHAGEDGTAEARRHAT